MGEGTERAAFAVAMATLALATKGAGPGRVLATAGGRAFAVASVGEAVGIVEAAVAVALSGVAVLSQGGEGESSSGGKGNDVIQSGGRTVKDSTARALNKYSGQNHGARDWGRALEALKEHFGLRGNDHGQIFRNGDYTGPNGDVVGNIMEFLP